MKELINTYRFFGKGGNRKGGNAGKATPESPSQTQSEIPPKPQDTNHVYEDDPVERYQDGVIQGTKPVLVTWDAQIYDASLQCPNCKSQFQSRIGYAEGELQSGRTKCPFCDAKLTEIVYRIKPKPINK